MRKDRSCEERQRGVRRDTETERKRDRQAEKGRDHVGVKREENEGRRGG